MANLEVTPSWPLVRQLETNEFARGGASGNLNEQAKALTARTEFLKLDAIEQKFKNAEILTPEMFGAKGDGVTDDTAALVNMFKSCTDMPIGSGITAEQINAKLHSNNYKTIRLTKLYRHTAPLHYPPCIQFDQPVTGFFSKNGGTIGLFYDPSSIALDTYAGSPFVYKRQLDGTYSLDTSPYTLPTGGQFDDGSYIMAGQRIDLGNLSICTKPGVTLGLRLVGFAGSIAGAINVGTNHGEASRIPKVGVLTNGCWRSVFNAPSVLASVQGWVNWGSNGGMTVNNPYINKGYNATAVADIVPIYNPPDHTENGAIAITNAADCFWNQPITEHWYFNYVSTHHLRVLHPHIEGRSTRNVFYFIARANNAATADIELKPILTVDQANPLSSIVYLKNCDIQSSIVLKGRVLGAATVVRGVNSSACVTFNVSRNHYFIQAAKWGNLSLIRNINNSWGETVIYVDPVNGNDEAIGLRDLNALKTLTNVKRLAELMGIRNVQVVNNIDVSGFVDLHANAIFTGQKINVAASSGLRFNAKALDVHFNNSELSSAFGVAPIQVTGVSAGVFGFTCNLTNQAVLITTSNNVVLDLNIATNVLPVGANFVYGGGAKQFVSVNLNTTASYTGASVSGTAVLVKAPHLTASAAVVATSVPANSRTALATLPLPGCRLGQKVDFAYDKNLIGLDVSGYVSSSNTVSYYFENRTEAAISLSAGNLIARVTL